MLASVGEATVDGQSYNSEFWYDTVRAYKALIELGYKPEHVLVLYGSGTDFASEVEGYSQASLAAAGIPLPITDYSIKDADGNTRKDNLGHLLCCLATGCESRLSGTTCRCSHFVSLTHDRFSCRGIPRIRTEDSLLVWLRGHGYNEGRENTCIRFSDGRYLKEDELRALLGYLATKRRVLVIDTCHSGGLLDGLEQRAGIVVASTGEPRTESAGAADSYRYNESSYTALYDEYGTAVYHSAFSHWLFSGLAGSVRADADSDTLVSVREGFDLAASSVRQEYLEGRHGEMHSGIRDPDSVAPCTYAAMPCPGAAAQLYFLSTPGQDLAEPHAAPRSCPDLVVGSTRQSDDATDSEPQLTGQRNQALALRVQATVHNAGCAPEATAIVTFNARAAGEAEFREFGRVLVPHVPRGGEGVAAVEWTPAAPGTYEVEARLATRGNKCPLGCEGPYRNTCAARIDVGQPRP